MSPAMHARSNARSTVCTRRGKDHSIRRDSGKLQVTSGKATAWMRSRTWMSGNAVAACPLKSTGSFAIAESWALRIRSLAPLCRSRQYRGRIRTGFTQGSSRVFSGLPRARAVNCARNSISASRPVLSSERRPRSSFKRRPRSRG